MVYKFNEPKIQIKGNGFPSVDYKEAIFDLEKYSILLKQLKDLLLKFDKYSEFNFLPIQVSYNKVVPKTQRIRTILKFDDSPKQIGSKFLFNSNHEIEKINIIYSVSKESLQNSIDLLNAICGLFSEKIVSEIKNFIYKDEYNKQFFKSFLQKNGIKSKHYLCVLDLNHIEKFDLPSIENAITKQIVSIYDIIEFKKFLELLKVMGVDLSGRSPICNEFIELSVDEIEKIKNLYPFLISLQENDVEMPGFNVMTEIDLEINIPPSNETKCVVGVIDSKANLKNYWKTYQKSNTSFLPTFFESNESHGTAVSSLIIGRDVLNDKHKDGLGTFNIKTFEILPNENVYTSYVMRCVDKIVRENTDIKIWNLSLGGKRDDNNLSVFGKMLDILQNELDIQFIVAAGNLGHDNLNSPADSLTAITVGAKYINYDGVFTNCIYSSSGEVFDFYTKPNTFEIANTGAKDEFNEINALTPNSKLFSPPGTSFACPLATRKIAFLYLKYGLKLETCRAIINYLSAISINGIPDLTMLENEKDYFIILEGKIGKADKRKFIPVKLPVNENNYCEFVANYAVSHNISNRNNVGDEYSTTNIKVILATKNGNKFENHIVALKSKAIEDDNATETTLRKHYGKYNPNKVVLGQHFYRNKGRKVNLNDFVFKVERLDLLENEQEYISYGAILHIKETIPNSMKNFLINNLENVIDISLETTIELDA